MLLTVVGVAEDSILTSIVEELTAVVESDSATITADTVLPELQDSQLQKVVGQLEELAKQIVVAAAVASKPLVGTSSTDQD